MAFNRTLNNLKRLQHPFLQNQIAQQIAKNKDFIISLNQDQLLLGRDSKNNEISPEYAQDEYKAYKISLNPAGEGNVDLRNTGVFYNGFWLKVDGDKFTLYSSDAKTGRLVKKYGGDIFGLTEYSKKILGEKMGSYLIQEINKCLRT